MTDAAAGVAGEVLIALFEVVEFFEDGEGDDDVVLFEDEEGVGIVDEDFFVEDEGLDAFSLVGCGGLAHARSVGADKAGVAYGRGRRLEHGCCRSCKGDGVAR